MQMKNLLRLIGALTLTTGAAISVVACDYQTAVDLKTALKNDKLGKVTVANVNSPTVSELKTAIKAVKENENINLDGISVEIIKPESGQVINSAKVSADGKIYNGEPIVVTFTLLADAEVTKDIKTALEAGVDGSSLTASQKQSAAHDVIEAAIKKVTVDIKDKVATFSFVNGDEVLTAGDNTVNIKVTFGTSTIDVAVKLTAVQKTDADVTKDIKTALEAGVDGSSLTASQKQSAAHDVIEAAIKKVTVDIKDKVATFSFVNGDEVLTAGDNTVNIKVTFGTSTIDVAVKLTAVQKTDADVTKDIKTALEAGVDGSSLTASQKQSAAHDVIEAAIKKVTVDIKDKVATFSFVNGDEVLTAGDNTVNIKVTFGTSTIDVAVKLTGVKEK